MKNLNILIIMGSLAISACGGGGNSSGSGPSLEPPIGDLSGEWNVIETQELINNSCADAANNITKSTVYLTQSGNSVKLSGATQNGAPYSFNGTLSGKKFTYSGKTSDVETATATITINTNCNAFSGRSDWVFDNGFVICSGFTSLSGKKTFQTGCGALAPGSLYPPSIFFLVAKVDGKGRNVVIIKWEDYNSRLRSTTTIIERSLNDESNYQKVAAKDLLTITPNKAKILNLPPKTDVYFRMYEVESKGSRSAYSTVKFVTTL